MNRTNRIRIFYVVTTIAACLSCYLGYQLMQELKQTKEPEYGIQTAETEHCGEAVTEAEAGRIQTSYEYMVVEEEGYLTVYKKDLETVFLYTDIRMDELTEELQEEIAAGKPFEELTELYDFLESYSS